MLRWMSAASPRLSRVMQMQDVLPGGQGEGLLEGGFGDMMLVLEIRKG